MIIEEENCQDPCGARWALWPGPLVSDTARERAIVFYGKVNAFPGEFNFNGVGQSIALWHEDETHPQRLNFDVVADYPTLMFGADEPSFGPGAFAHDNHLYVYACDRIDLIKPCRLARAPMDTITLKSTWEYFDNNNNWSNSSQNLQALFHGNDIMSVSFNHYLQSFLAVYSEPLSRNLQMRTAPRPEGPWSRPVPVATAESTANGNGWVYDGLAHAEMNQEDGQVIFVTYTRDPGNGTREMRMLRVEIKALP